MKKTVSEFLSMPYAKEVIQYENGSFFIKIKELPGCMSEGDTLQEAYEMIQDALKDWIAVALERGQDIPLPATVVKNTYSGKFMTRIPVSLHKRLVENAKKNKISLNAHINNLLAERNSQIETLENCLKVLTIGIWRSGLKTDALKWSIPATSFPKLVLLSKTGTKRRSPTISEFNKMSNVFAKQYEDFCKGIEIQQINVIELSFQKHKNPSNKKDELIWFSYNAGDASYNHISENELVVLQKYFFNAYEEKKTRKGEEREDVFELEATFELIYKTENKMNDEIFASFSDRISIICHPFFREILSSSLMKSGMPPTNVPLLQKNLI